MQLVSTVLVSAVSTSIRLAIGFVSIKIIAVFVGPVGVALLGQFQNFVSMVMTVATGAINNGLIKYTSEFKHDQEERYKVWRTAVWINIILIVPVSLFLIIFHNWLSIFFFKDVGYSSIFIIFGGTLLFYVANQFILNILNGLHEIKKFAIINISASIAGLLLNIALVYKWKIYGALLGLILSQTAAFAVGVMFVINSDWFKLSCFFGKYDKEYLKKLFNYTLMSITALCMVPIGQLIIRNYLANHTSWEMAGCWQGMQRISDTYLAILYTALSTYYLPKLANLQDKNLIKTEIYKGYKLIMPGLILITLIIYTQREFIVKLLFTKTFMPMIGMFFWQLTGDVIKIATWILSYVMVAKSKTRLFIFNELIFGSSLILFSILFTYLWGANGPVMAFCINYILNFLYFVYLFRSGRLI